MPFVLGLNIFLNQSPKFGSVSIISLPAKVFIVLLIPSKNQSTTRNDISPATIDFAVKPSIPVASYVVSPDFSLTDSKNVIMVSAIVLLGPIAFLSRNTSRNLFCSSIIDFTDSTIGSTKLFLTHNSLRRPVTVELLNDPIASLTFSIMPAILKNESVPFDVSPGSPFEVAKNSPKLCAIDLYLVSPNASKKPTPPRYCLVSNCASSLALILNCSSICSPFSILFDISKILSTIPGIARCMKAAES